MATKKIDDLSEEEMRELLKPLFNSQLLTFVMTRKDALEMGLLTCTCGHPENNHFDFASRNCAHCPRSKCGGFTEVARRGKLLKEMEVNRPLSRRG